MSVEPFPSDLAAVDAELAWVEIRARRLGAARRANTPDDDDGAWHSDPDSRKQASKQARRFLAQEKKLRAELDARRAVSDTALDRLCRTHGLSDAERAILLIAAAPAFSKRFEQYFGSMTTDVGFARATVEVAFTFLDLSLAERIEARRWFRRDAPLRANDLLVVELFDRYAEPEQLLDAHLTLTWRTFQYLVGDALPHDELLEFSSLEEPQATLDRVVLAPEDKRRILSVIDKHGEYLEKRRAWGFDEVIQYGRGVILLFHGSPGTGKTMTAHGIASHLGRRVLNVDIPTFVNSHEHHRFLPSLFREARLQNAILFFDECEALFEARTAGNLLMNQLLTEIERFEGIAILATNAASRLDPALERRILVRLRFPEPDREARREIWAKHLPPTAPLAADVDLDALAGRFELAGGYIKNAVLMALARTVHEGRDRICQADLEVAARDQLVRITDDEEQLVVPQVRLSDVALSDENRRAVEEIVAAARNRRRVLERWGIGAHLTYGKGIAALFHGPPGTGKTLCAESIAGELGRPLVVCSLPTLLSQWVGGTEQNLAGLFDQARRHNAVLLLDEADAWLGAREGLQQHDVRTTNLLLTLIERHDGLVLLASNRDKALDPALRRRLSWCLHFEEPDVVCRAEIWRRLLPPSAPTEGDLRIGYLARTYALTGAQIRNAVYRAAFRAAREERPIDALLLEGAAVEELGEQAPAHPMGGWD